MSEEVSSNTKTMAQLMAENARRRDKNKALQAELDALRAEHKTAVSERDSLRTAVAAHDPKLAEENADLKAQLRLHKHRDGLRELAYSEEIGVSKSVTLDKLIKLAEYKADTDDFDAGGARKLLLGLKESDPYLFGPGAGPGAGGDPQGARQQGTPPSDQSHLWRAVAARGSSAGVGSGGITREQARDAAFVMGQAAERRKAAGIKM